MNAPAVLAQKLTLPELARHWGWNPQVLRHLCATNQIPHLRIGRKVYFELDRVGPWLEEHRRGEAQKGRPTPSREEECRRLGIPVNHRFS